MANLNIDSVTLVSTQRKVPLNGAPSSQDWNDSEQEKIVDFVALAAVINDIIRPILNALPSGAATGLEGRTLYADTTDQDPIFFDSSSSASLTVADSLRALNAILTLHKNQLADLDIEVGQLQAKLSSTNQNDIAKTLQSLTSSLNAIANTQKSQADTLNLLQAQFRQTRRFHIGPVGANTTNQYTVNWPTAFVDNNYTVVASMEGDDNSFELRVLGVFKEAAGVGVIVSVQNADPVTPRSGSINLIAIHD